MKNILIVLVIIGFSFVADAQEKNGVIEVSGKAQMSVAPDQAVFNLTVTSSNLEFSKCLDNLNSQVTKLKSTLGKAGIKEDDIKTKSYNIRKEYGYDSGVKKLIGHKAIHQLEVKVALDKEKMKSVNTAILLSGIDVQMNIGFTISNPEKYKTELIVNAVNDAKNKAQTISQAAGIEITGVKKITYGNQSANPFAAQKMSMTAPMSMDEGSFDAGVNPGNMNLTESILIIYYIK